MPSSPYCVIYLWWKSEREKYSWSLIGVQISKAILKSEVPNNMCYISGEEEEQEQEQEEEEEEEGGGGAEVISWRVKFVFDCCRDF